MDGAADSADHVRHMKNKDQRRENQTFTLRLNGKFDGNQFVSSKRDHDLRLYLSP